jgi:hypothetical protein
VKVFEMMRWDFGGVACVCVWNELKRKKEKKGERRAIDSKSASVPFILKFGSGFFVVSLVLSAKCPRLFGFVFRNELVSWGLLLIRVCGNFPTDLLFFPQLSSAVVGWFKRRTRPNTFEGGPRVLAICFACGTGFV